MLKRDHQLVLPTQARAPGFRVELRGTTFRLVATGAWTVAEATQLDRALKRLRVPIPPTPDFTGEMDIAGIAEIDTAGALLLQRTAAAWEKSGLRTRYAGATESFRILIEEVRSKGRAERPKIEKRSALQFFTEDMAKTLTGVWTDAVQLTGFLGEVTAAFIRLFRQPWRFRTTSFIHHLDHAGFRAVPIIALICFLIGAVVMQQGVVQLKPFGAEPFAVNMVAILALREVGILLTAIMVAGRSGSAFTAEIGSMKMREEIDAMRTLGIDPMDTLVLPRILALVVALPLLTFIGDLMGLAGGGLMAFAVLGLDASNYVDKLRDVIDFQHFMAGMIKAPFAAVIIGLVGCLEGLKVEGSAESLGTHVTSRRGQGHLPGDNFGRRFRHVSVGDRSVIVDNGREVVIRVRGLAKSFGSHQIWDGLNLDVYRGEILAIVGGSGQGKSVLMRVITGLVIPDAGEVGLFGQNTKTLSPQDRLDIERRWGILFQDGALFSSLTVLQNIQVPMREHLELPQAMMDDLAFLKLSMVGLPPNAAYKFPSELSGGMRKRAGLARALALDPEIVFLDEPTAGLDPIGATDFDHLIRKLQQTLGLTVYMVTHDLDTIFTVCDRVAVLADKKIVRTGSPTELQRHPNHPWIKDYFCGERARAASPGERPRIPA